MRFEETMENVARAFEIVGVVVIIFGGLLALLVGMKDFDNSEKFFSDVRRSFGRPLILGLEVLVAADIIETITVQPSLENAAALGVLVLVRVVLSFSLDIEIEGMVPWRRTETKARLEAQESAT